MVNEGFHDSGMNGSTGGGFAHMQPASANPNPGQNSPRPPQHAATPVPSASAAPQASPREHPAGGQGSRRGRSHRAKVSSKPVSPETVGAILDAAGKVSRLEGNDASMLRDLLGLPDNTSDNKLIATFISREGRTKALKRVEAELEMLESIRGSQQSGSLDFDAVFAIIDLGHDDRLERWTLASRFDIDAAKAVAGTDDGKWPRSWNKSKQDESKGLYRLYLRILKPYSEKMEWFKRILA